MNLRSIVFLHPRGLYFDFGLIHGVKVFGGLCSVRVEKESERSGMDNCTNNSFFFFPFLLFFECAFSPRGQFLFRSPYHCLFQALLSI